MWKPIFKFSKASNVYEQTHFQCNLTSMSFEVVIFGPETRSDVSILNYVRMNITFLGCGWYLGIESTSFLRRQDQIRFQIFFLSNNVVIRIERQHRPIKTKIIAKDHYSAYGQSLLFFDLYKEPLWQLCAAMMSWVKQWVELVVFWQIQIFLSYLQKITKSFSKFLLFPFF